MDYIKHMVKVNMIGNDHIWSTYLFYGAITIPLFNLFPSS